MRLATFFIMVITLALAPRLGADTGGLPDVGNMTISLGPTKAFAFSTASLASPRGLSGRIELYGIRADGGRTLLCTTSLGWAESVDLLFYADAGLRALSAERHTADGQIARVTTRMPPGFDASAADEAAIRLASRAFPSWQRETGVAPASARIMVETVDDMAAYAMSRLFMPWRNQSTLLVLAFWSAVAIAAPPLAGKRQGRRASRRAALVVTSALSVSLLVAMMTLPRPRIYSIGVVAPGLSGPVATESRTNPVRYESTGIAGSGWSDIRWDTPDAAKTTLRFILADAAGTAGLPLDALKPYQRIRFKAAPIIIMPEDSPAMLSPGMLMAWGLHE